MLICMYALSHTVPDDCFVVLMCALSHTVPDDCYVDLMYALSHTYPDDYVGFDVCTESYFPG